MPAKTKEPNYPAKSTLQLFPDPKMNEFVRNLSPCARLERNHKSGPECFLVKFLDGIRTGKIPRAREKIIFFENNFELRFL